MTPRVTCRNIKIETPYRGRSVKDRNIDEPELYIPYYKGKKKLCKLYTNPTFNPASL